MMKIDIATPWATSLLIGLSALLGCPTSALADAAVGPPDRQAITSSDPTIDTGHLKVRLRPLMKAETEIEARAWLGLLQEKLAVIGEVELRLSELAMQAAQNAKTGEEVQPSEENGGLQEQLVQLRAEESDIAERTRIILQDLKKKGGDVADYEAYVDVVSGISGATDVTSFWAAFQSWLKSPDGGQVWLRRGTVSLVILLVFWLISKVAGRIAERALGRHEKVSNLLKNFVRKTAGALVLLIGLVMALGALGVEIGPLMAAMGAGGFIVGFALQETLGNFASGLMLMVYRPFDLDDFVSLSGESGTVKAMSLVSTTLRTTDNKNVIIPNKMVFSGTITNFTGEERRRVDLVFGIGYEDNIEKAIAVLMDVASAHERVLDDPPVSVKVKELADSSVNLLLLPWSKTEDYWTVYWDLTRQVKERFDEEGISIPYPQQDVHMHSAVAMSESVR